MGARIVVVGSVGSIGESDVDGRFGITGIGPGTYGVRATKGRFGSTRVENVVVAAGKTAEVRASLKPKNDSNVEVLEVSADVKEASQATQLLKRKMAPTVSDNLGAESISRTPDSDAAEVVTRVPAVTIKDDAFIIVRGLGDRYNSALINSSLFPSTDPTRRIVPLDLFPAGFIESLTLVKSYTPDLPGDFAGGLVNISLTDPPLEPHMSLGLTLGGNTTTTFGDFDTYDGCGAADYFGFGDGCRKLDFEFPEKNDAGDPLSRVTPLQRIALIRSLKQNWNTSSVDAPPSYGISAEAGNTWGPLGINTAMTYRGKYARRSDEILRTRSGRGTISDDFVYDRSTFKTDLGALATSVLKINQRHRISANTILNRKSSDEVLVGFGQDRLLNNDEDRLGTRSIYTTDQLLSLQFTGQHSFGVAEVDWRAALSQSRRWQPDGKFTIYRRDNDEDNPAFTLALAGSAAGSSTTRFFSELDELLQDYGVDVSIPTSASLSFLGLDLGGQGRLSVGAVYTTRARDFKLRLLQTTAQPGLSGIDFTASPDSILRPENYATALDLRDSTNRAQQRFTASQDIAGAYIMLDMPIVGEKLRVVGGVRSEYSYIRVKGVDPERLEPFDRIINDFDFLPALSLVYAPRDDMNVRLAASQTVSRPQFREMNPAQFPTSPGERAFRGNADLDSSTIQNLDFRWEWFLSPLELVSVGLFAKNLGEPIETNVRPATTVAVETMANAGSAVLWGAEFEARKNFEFAMRYLRQWDSVRPYVAFLTDVELLSNVTLVESEAKGFRPLPGQQTVNVTDARRPLTDQAPFVINASIQYDDYRYGLFRLLYNTVGKTIVAAGNNAGGQNLPNVELQRRDQLDFVWLKNWSLLDTPFKTKLSVENITNDDHLETHGQIDDQTVITNRYFTGVSFSAGLTFEF